MMDTSTKQHRSRLARTFAKVLHVRSAVSAFTPVDSFLKPAKQHRLKSNNGAIKPGHNKPKLIVNSNKLNTTNNHHHHHPSAADGSSSSSSSDLDNEEQQLNEDRLALEAFMARVFANISSIKAAYAQLQFAQSPYDAESIQSSDHEVVSLLKNLSELKHCYVKNQLDTPSPEKVLLAAEVQEQRSVLKTYEIMKKKLEAQVEAKTSELISLREKLEECRKENKLMERRLNASGQLSLSVPDNLHLSGLSPNHFTPVLTHAVRSVRSFVKVLISGMQSSGWDLDAAANSIHPGVKYWKQDHKCFAFESFVCRVMFDGFQQPNFSLPTECCVNNDEPRQRRRLFFERFMELRSVKGKDYLAQKPKSTFGKFCRVKYLRLVHPKMEASMFGGDMSIRNVVNSGEFGTIQSLFFASFAEMAKRVWLLHCLAFSFESPAMVFQIKRHCRFSEVFMESVVDDDVEGGGNNGEVEESYVGFTVVPGFKIGKTVIQSQVYISRS